MKKFIALLLAMIMVLGMVACGSKTETAAPAPEAAPAAPQAEPKTAPGSAGGVKLYNVEPKTAAMLMAIVADKMQKPINELRFISIKEVEK